MTGVRVAQISCGTEYSGIQWLLNDVAEEIGVELVYPEMELSMVSDACKEIGFEVESPALNMMMAHAVSILDDPTIKGAILLTCFKCSEGAIVKDIVRRFLHERTAMPIITYSNVEKPKEIELYSRIEALKTIITKKALLMREKQEGITMGVDSGSSTTKAVVMSNNKIIGKGWLPTTDIIKSADEAIEVALKEANMKYEKLDAVGVTGYGREIVSDHIKADLNLDETSVVSKGAVFLANQQKGEATIIDIGGMSNKLILVRDGIPHTFTFGGICGGSSGRFLEVTSHRLNVDISKMGGLALQSREKFELESYCMVFGIQSLVVTLSSGVKREDVAAAACRSVANQVYENQIQEIEVRPPVIFVGGVSLIEGVVKEFEDMLGMDIIAPPYSQYAGAVGIATLVSGLKKSSL